MTTSRKTFVGVDAVDVDQKSRAFEADHPELAPVKRYTMIVGKQPRFGEPKGGEWTTTVVYEHRGGAEKS